MKSPRVSIIIAMDWPPETEEKYNRWHEGVHIPMLMKFKGLLRVTRYRMLGEGANPRYMTIYEFENKEACEAYEKSPELAAARADSKATWQPIPPARWRVAYEHLGTWEK